MSVEQELRQMVREVIVEELEARRPGSVFGWLTVDEAAEKFKITPDAVRRRVREKRMPGVIHDGRVYVDLVEFDRVLRRRR